MVIFSKPEMKGVPVQYAFVICSCNINMSNLRPILVTQFTGGRKGCGIWVISVTLSFD